MQLVHAGAIEYYRDTIAKVEISFFDKGKIRNISQVKRLEFNFGAVLASIELVAEVAKLIFHGMCVLLTAGQNDSFKTALKENFNEYLICLSAITIGCAGLLFPGTVNEKILGIPPQGLTVTTT